MSIYYSINLKTIMNINLFCRVINFTHKCKTATRAQFNVFNAPSRASRPLSEDRMLKHFNFLYRQLKHLSIRLTFLPAAEWESCSMRCSHAHSRCFKYTSIFCLCTRCLSSALVVRPQHSVSDKRATHGALVFNILPPSLVPSLAPAAL